MVQDTAYGHTVAVMAALDVVTHTVVLGMAIHTVMAVLGMVSHMAMAVIRLLVMAAMAMDSTATNPPYHILTILAIGLGPFFLILLFS